MGNQQTGVQIAPAIRYALHDGAGLWLHFSLERGADGALRMTKDRDYRWLGTVAQLDAVRERYPETFTHMQAVKISPSMAYSKEK